MITLDTANMCSHLQKKLFDEDGEYHRLWLATQLGADLVEIVPVELYDGDFQATIERGKKKLDERAYPEIHPLAIDVANYDVIFLGYPMLHAQAKTVVSRVIPEGTEYLFTAVDLPREGGPDMPPAGEMQVYVSVIGEDAPVTTKVIR